MMFTIERSRKKINEDVKKLLKAREYLQQQGDTVKLWEITKSEPTADQREEVRHLKVKVELLSLETFRGRLIDAESYFSARRRYAFGSAVDPMTGSINLDTSEYIPLGISDALLPQKQSIASLVRMLEEKKVVTLLGGFGAGKSLTIREIFFALQNRFANASHKLIPIAINLRDHWGQLAVPEVLGRHSNALGYERPNDLVRIWNAETAIALLDGFDELGSQSIASTRRTRHTARRAATEIIRQFVTSARGRMGVLIAGRGHYFDDLKELRSCCGLFESDPIFELEPFSEADAAKYLKRKGIDAGIPDWVPRTPLLLGYLTSGGLLEAVAGLPRKENQAMAWNAFLDLIAERDAKLSHDIDPVAIRQLLERLATRTRREQEITEIDEADLTDAFREVTGSAVVDATHVLLQRLPGLQSAGATLGLTPRLGAEGRRSFVDSHMREALEGSDLIRFLLHPFAPFSGSTMQRPLSSFGCEVAGFVAEQGYVQPQQHLVAAKEATHRHSDPTLALDCLLASSERPDVETIDCEGLSIKDAYADEVDASRLRLKNLTLHYCAINTLSLTGEPPDGFVLERPFVLRVEGAASSSGLPDWVRNPEEVGGFDISASNDALMSLIDIPLPVRVLLTIIRKLFVQRGSGRVDGALRRGLDPSARDYVGPILTRLVSEKAIFRTQHGNVTVWHPSPQSRARMLAILGAPLAVGDPLVKDVIAIK